MKYYVFVKTSFKHKVRLVGDFFLTLTIFFMLTIYTLQIKLYCVGNIVV